MKKEDKTNAMRLLENCKVDYKAHYLGFSEAKSATEMADILHADYDRVFKTLVTVGKSGEHYVFVVPSFAELDLKKAAIATGEKSVSMIPQKELLPLTGYIHGGCSPLGMKKKFRTFIDKTAEGKTSIFFSAGKIGVQIETTPEGLCSASGAEISEII